MKYVNFDISQENHYGDYIERYVSERDVALALLAEIGSIYRVDDDGCVHVLTDLKRWGINEEIVMEKINKKYPDLRYMINAKNGTV